MSYFMLPDINYKIDTNDILIKNSIEPIEIIISKTLHIYLENSKKQIDENIDTWDFIKKYTNPYEFIHTIVPNYKFSISKMKPLSRSFYKMVEISNLLNIFQDFKTTNINTFHLAEGPGGFIEATKYLRDNSNDKYYGMTLIKETDPNVPGWKKSEQFLESNSNIIIEKGINENGDLLDLDNLKYCHEKYKNTMDVITGDGGFDFSIDFNKQETLATNLLFAQISFAIAMQKINGHFILKFFDTFTKSTIDLIYLLGSMYKNVYIIKPHSSRLANSEKYIVCKYFKGDNNILSKIFSEYNKLNEYSNISSILNFNIDNYFNNKLEEINAIFGQLQIENINSTLNLINNKAKNDKLDVLKKSNVQKCIYWCEKHSIQHNKNSINTNIFIN